VVLVPDLTVQAQESLPPGPVYIVEEGDFLWDIAYRFHVSQEELANINGISNFDQIAIGQQLVIPGLEGLQGVLTTLSVAFGESLHSLSLRYRISESLLRRLNHITSPNELYAGYSLIVTQDDIHSTPGKRVTLGTGQTLLELAVLNDLDAWSLMAANDVQSGWSILPGDVIRIPAGTDDGPGALPPLITSVKASGLTQGATAEVLISGEADLLLSGSLFDHKLNVFPANDGGYFALQGVHAMAEPGLYPLVLKITTPDGDQFD